MGREKRVSVGISFMERAREEMRRRLIELEVEVVEEEQEEADGDQ